MRKAIIVSLAGLATLGITCLTQYNPPSKYTTSEAKVGLAHCLVQQGATMYGTYWCGGCNKQKEEFGAEAWNTFRQNYMECSERGPEEVQQRCEQDNIAAYPTWKFKNGREVIGYKTLDKLAELSGCD